MGEHRIQIDNIRLFIEFGQMFKNIADNEVNTLGDLGSQGRECCPFQTIKEEGGDDRVVFEHPNPAAGCRQEKTVASESGGGIDDQGRCGVPDLRRLHQEFAAGAAMAAACGGAGKVNPEGPGQLRIIGLVQFQVFRSEPQQERLAVWLTDQGDSQGSCQMVCPFGGTLRISEQGKRRVEDVQGLSTSCNLMDCLVIAF